MGNPNKDRYHVIKSSRVYRGEGYYGPSSNYTVQEYDSKSSAVTAALKMQDYNPVGWDVYDSITGALVYSAR